METGEDVFIAISEWMGWFDGWLSLVVGSLRAPAVLINIDF